MLSMTSTKDKATCLPLVCRTQDGRGGAGGAGGNRGAESWPICLTVCLPDLLMLFFGLSCRLYKTSQQTLYCNQYETYFFDEIVFACVGQPHEVGDSLAHVFSLRPGGQSIQRGSLEESSLPLSVCLARWNCLKCRLSVMWCVLHWASTVTVVAICP